MHSLESIEKMRKSKIGPLNPMWKKDRSSITQGNKAYKLKWIMDKFKEQPWRRHYVSIKARCAIKDPSHKHYRSYFLKGIKCFISLDDVKYLWFRDNASKLKKPSIDRIDADGHYEIPNCRFIELSENSRRPKSTFGKTNPYPGVSWCKRSNKWCVKNIVNGKAITLGRIVNLDEAISASKKFRDKYINVR